MEFQDFLFFAIPLLFLLASLAAIYFALRFFRWPARNRLIRDAWYVWLVLLIATLVFTLGFLAFGIEQILVVLPLIFVADIAVAAVTLKWLSRPEKEARIFENTTFENPTTGVWKVAVFTCVFSFTAVIGLALFCNLTSAVYERLNPQPEPKFKFYDI